MKWLKYFRQAKRFSQRELADAVGVQENTVWRWENSKAAPSIGFINNIVDFLDITKEELFDGPSGTDIVVKIKRKKKEVEDMSIEVDMTGRDLVQSVTVAGDRIGIGIVYGGGKTLRDVCDELLRREEQFEKMRTDAR